MSSLPSARSAAHDPALVCDFLLEAVDLQLYQVNSFRVLDLPVTATPGEASRQADRLAMALALGRAPNNHLLPMPVAPDAGAVRQAAHRLLDPQMRIVDELFWFWPLNGGDPDQDQALRLLRSKQIGQAAQVWLSLERAGNDGFVPLHNLAVLYHVLALDPGTLCGAESAPYWKASLPCWQRLCRKDGFWHVLEERIRQIDDPRLPPSAAQGIRSKLPDALLSVNAALAAEAAQRGDAQAALSHVGLIESSGFDDQVRRDALRQAVSPLRKRLKEACQIAEKATDDLPESGLDAGNSLLSQAGPALGLIDQLLAPDHPTRQAAHDEVAETLLRSQAAYANKTKRWRECLPGLQKALGLAASNSSKERMREQIKACENNSLQDTCWFCKSRLPDEKAKIEVKMHKVTERVQLWNQVQVRYNTVSLQVPRCAECSAAHGHAGNWLVMLGLLGAVAGAVIGGILNGGGDNACVLVAIGAVIGAVVLGAIGNAMGDSIIKGRGTAPEGTKNEYPPIKELTKDGWSFGEKPSTS